MFFSRATILLAIGILALPTDPAKQAKVFATAKDATHWTLTFCDRNPETCTKGRQAWGVFLEKAEFGAKMAYEIVSERTAANATPPAGRVGARNTLLPSDLAPAWRGHPRRTG